MLNAGMAELGKCASLERPFMKAEKPVSLFLETEAGVQTALFKKAPAENGAEKAWKSPSQRLIFFKKED